MSRAQISVPLEIERLEDAGAGHHPARCGRRSPATATTCSASASAVAAAERLLPAAPRRASDRRTRDTDRAPSATLRKMRSPQTIGVEPDHAGSASFQVMFSVFDQRTGRFFSPLMPLSDGPRHCGQFSADSAAAAPHNRTSRNRFDHATLTISDARLSGHPRTDEPFTARCLAPSPPTLHKFRFTSAGR